MVPTSLAATWEGWQVSASLSLVDPAGFIILGSAPHLAHKGHMHPCSDASTSNSPPVCADTHILWVLTEEQKLCRFLTSSSPLMMHVVETSLLSRSQQGVTIKLSRPSRNTNSPTLQCSLAYETAHSCWILHAPSDETVHKPRQLASSPLSAGLVLAKADDFPDRTFFHWKVPFAMSIHNVVFSFLNK